MVGWAPWIEERSHGNSMRDLRRQGPRIIDLTTRLNDFSVTVSPSFVPSIVVLFVVVVVVLVLVVVLLLVVLTLRSKGNSKLGSLVHRFKLKLVPIGAH